MRSVDDEGSVLVTGACGHVGRAVCDLLRSRGRLILPLDINPDPATDVVRCDLTSTGEVSRLFRHHSIRAVIHLAGVLPSAFQSDPLRGAEVNLGGSFAIMRQAADARVNRFVFASSMSVYGSRGTPRPLKEDDSAVPDEPYGASKRAVELIGETLSDRTALQFVALRIARVVGPGIRKTASPWRSQIFEPPRPAIHIPFSPEATLSLVHVEDVARMLVALADVASTSCVLYNTPAEVWKARQLKHVVEELRSIPVELGEAQGGPICDGNRFAREFRYRPRRLRDYFSDSLRHR